jgi:predicted dehydrogenase
VASPASFHAEHAVPLLQAGIPTLIEKPVTSDVEDSQYLKQVAAKTGTPVAVGYCLRYLPSAMKVKELLDAKAIGTLYNAHIEIGQYLPDWRPSKDYRDSVSANASLGGGALLELSHELDYSQWLLGPLAVQFAHLRSSDELDLDVEDLADIVATTEAGAVVNIHLDFLQRKAYRRCRFVGSTSVLEWDLIANNVIQISASGEEILYSEPAWDKNKMYLNMLQDFINMTKDNKHSCIDLQQAGKTVELIETIKQYAKTQTTGWTTQ